MKHSEWRTIGRAALALLLFVAAACAPKAPPALPAALKYPDFIYPVVPDALRGAAAVERIDRGWRFLQNGNTDAAHREFTAALKVNRSPPAGTPTRFGSRFGFGWPLASVVAPKGL